MAEMKAERAAAVKILEDRFEAHMKCIGGRDTRSGDVVTVRDGDFVMHGASSIPYPTDPTVPHGYPSWKDYALVLQHEAKINGATIDRYVDRCGELESQVEQLRDTDEGATDPPQGYSTWPDYYVEMQRRLDAREAQVGPLWSEITELRARVSRQRRELKQVNRCIREQKLELEVLRGRGTVESDPGFRCPTFVGVPDCIRPVDGMRDHSASQLVTSEEAERIGREVREDFKQAVRETEELGRKLDAANGYTGSSCSIWSRGKYG